MIEQRIDIMDAKLLHGEGRKLLHVDTQELLDLCRDWSGWRSSRGKDRRLMQAWRAVQPGKVK